MTPQEVIAFKHRHDLSDRELGRAAGLSENNAARMVRGWTAQVDTRDAPSGTAVAAMRYLGAILEVIEMLDADEAQSVTAKVRAHLVAALPDDLQQRC